QASLDFGAHLVALSATLPHHLPAMADAVAAIKAARPENPARIIIGGPALKWTPSGASTLGADASANTPEEAVSAAAQLFGLTSPG
ncbi:MAG: hypothetical protein PSX37_02845, partial [bacterium]|nr:hypothetical protein [bacterium]